MYSEILKALEMLLAAVRGAHSPERRRRQVARRLLQLHLDLDDLVVRGREFVRVARGSENEPSVLLDQILAQQQVLHRIIETLEDSAISGLLQVYLPHMRELHIHRTLYGKSDDLCFSMQELLTAETTNDLDEGAIAASKVKKSARVVLLSSPELTAQAEVALSRLDDLRQQLGRFLADKFKLEDVL